VLLGRATLYGVAAGGQPGASHALDLLANELRLALTLLGQSDLNQLRATAPTVSTPFFTVS